MSKATGRGKMVAAPVEEELAQEKEEKNDEEVDEAAAGKEEEAMGKEVSRTSLGFFVARWEVALPLSSGPREEPARADSAAGEPSIPCPRPPG